MRFLVLLALLVPLYAHSKSQVYAVMANHDFPSEIHLLLHSLPLEVLNPQDKAKVEGFVKNFSTYAAQLSTKDIYFIVKSESAKAILAARPRHTPQYQSYTLKKLDEIEEAAGKDSYRPWSKYVFQGLLQDARALVSDARFASLWRPIENSAGQGERAVFRRRVELVLSWVDYLAYTTAALANEKLQEVAFSTLERIERAGWLLSTLNGAPLTTPVPLAFEIKQLEEAGQKTVEQVLDKVIDPMVQDAAVKLPNPINDWLPREIPSTPQAGKNIIKKKDPFYTPPPALPKPTNDWILSL